MHIRDNYKNVRAIVMRVRHMGRIKSIAVKTLADEMIKEHGSKFTDDFAKNKAALAEAQPIKSKKVKNVLAGYITKKMKAAKKTGV